MCELKCSLFLYLPFLLLWSLGTDLRRRGAWSGDKHEMSDSADLQLTTDRSYSEERRRRPLEMDWESEGGALPPSWDIILQVGFISLWWEKSALILYFLAFQNFPHQIIVMFCLISQYHCQALQKNAYFRTKTHLPHWKIRKIEILIWAKFIEYVISYIPFILPKWFWI